MHLIKYDTRYHSTASVILPLLFLLNYNMALLGVIFRHSFLSHPSEILKRTAECTLLHQLSTADSTCTTSSTIYCWVYTSSSTTADSTLLHQLYTADSTTLEFRLDGTKTYSIHRTLFINYPLHFYFVTVPPQYHG